MDGLQERGLKRAPEGLYIYQDQDQSPAEYATQLDPAYRQQSKTADGDSGSPI